MENTSAVKHVSSSQDETKKPVINSSAPTATVTNTTTATTTSMLPKRSLAQLLRDSTAGARLMYRSFLPSDDDEYFIDGTALRESEARAYAQKTLHPSARLERIMQTLENKPLSEVGHTNALEAFSISTSCDDRAVSNNLDAIVRCTAEKCTHMFRTSVDCDAHFRCVYRAVVH